LKYFYSRTIYNFSSLKKNNYLFKAPLIIFINKKNFLNQNGDWGLGIGDWGLGIGDWGLGPIPNPQSPIPNPQSPIPNPQLFYTIELIKDN